MTRRTSEPFVYFARRADGEGPVKIGCSQLPEARLRGLMAWAPYKLEIVATLPGDETLERRFHAKFRDQHSHSEWFLPTPELTLVLAQLAAGVFNIGSLPPPKHLRTGAPRRPWSEKQRLAVSNGGRLRRIRKAGVKLPEHISSIEHGPWRADELTLLRNARIVRDWLDANHPETTPRRRVG